MAGMQEDNTATIYELWGDVLKRKWLLIASVICFGVIGIAVAFVSKPIYRAEIVMTIADTQDQEGLLGSLASNLGGFAALLPSSVSTRGAKDESLAVLLSRSFTKDFVESQNMMPVLFADHWDDKSGKWLDSDKPPTMNDAYRRFDNVIRGVEEDRLKGLIMLSIEWYDPELAAAWANLMVEQVNERIRVAAINEAELSLKYLKNELEKTSIVDLQQAIYGLIQGQVNNIMLANIRKEYAFKVIDPAVASNYDDFVSPRRLLLICAAILAGFLVGGFLALFLGAVDRARSMSARSQVSDFSHSEPDVTA